MSSAQEGVWNHETQAAGLHSSVQNGDSTHVDLAFVELRNYGTSFAELGMALTCTVLAFVEQLSCGTNFVPLGTASTRNSLTFLDPLSCGMSFVGLGTAFLRGLKSDFCL